MQMQMRWNGYAWGGDWVAFDDCDWAGSPCNSSVLEPKLTLWSIAATLVPKELRRSPYYWVVSWDDQCGTESLLKHP